MMTPVKVRPAEWLHEKHCLARAMICAVENLRDDEGEGDMTFRLAMQDGFALDEADSYLRTGTVECVCSAPWPEECTHEAGMVPDDTEGWWVCELGCGYHTERGTSVHPQPVCWSTAVRTMNPPIVIDGHEFTV